MIREERLRKALKALGRKYLSLKRELADTNYLLEEAYESSERMRVRAKEREYALQRDLETERQLLYARIKEDRKRGR